MHAILGLAASNLMSQDPSLVASALAHRLKAIRAIKKALADTGSSSSSSSGNGSSSGGGGTATATTTFEEEGNALIATCFALTFQSVCLEDGMAEYMTFCRGLVIVAIRMYQHHHQQQQRQQQDGAAVGAPRFVFRNFMGGDQTELLRPAMQAVPPIRREWTDMATVAVAALEPLCRHEVEREYHKFLVEWVEMLYVDSFQGATNPSPVSKRTLLSSLT